MDFKNFNNSYNFTIYVSFLESDYNIMYFGHVSSTKVYPITI
jgi:hypothetical protein